MNHVITVLDLFECCFVSQVKAKQYRQHIPSTCNIPIVHCNIPIVHCNIPIVHCNSVTSCSDMFHEVNGSSALCNMLLPATFNIGSKSYTNTLHLTIQHCCTTRRQKILCYQAWSYQEEKEIYWLTLSICWMFCKRNLWALYHGRNTSLIISFTPFSWNLSVSALTTGELIKYNLVKQQLLITIPDSVDSTV